LAQPHSQCGNVGEPWWLYLRRDLPSAYPQRLDRAMSATAEGSESEFVPTPEGQRVRDVFDLHEFGVALYRQRMRRENPDADDVEIDALTRAWLIAPPQPDRLRNALGDRAW